MERQAVKDRLQYVLSVLIFGTNGLILRHIGFPSEVVVLGRCMLGAAFILLMIRLRGGRVNWAALRQRAGWLVLSGFALGMNWIALFAAYLQTSVAVASLCNYTAPLVLIFAVPLLFREPIVWRKLPFVGMAAIGIVLVTGVLEGAAVGSVQGILLALGAALGFVTVVLCNRKLKDLQPLDKTAAQLLVSAVCVLPFALHAAAAQPLTPDPVSVLLTLVMGLLNTGFAYSLYFRSLTDLPVQTVALIGYLEPVVAVLTSALLLGEPLTPLGLLGAVLVIGAAAGSELMQ